MYRMSELSPFAKVGIAVGILILLYIVFKEKVDAWIASQRTVVTPVGPSVNVVTPDGKPTTVTPAVVTQPVVPPAPLPPPSYKFKGCYVDDGSRVLPQNIGYQVALGDCANQARAAGFKAFGIQYSAGQGMLGTGGECWTGNDSGYNRLGAANNCEVANGNTFGGAWSNAVYEWDRL